MIEECFPDAFGNLRPFSYAVTSEGAEVALAHFIDHALPSFVDYQDAMLAGEPFHYHSLLSLYMNARLLDPLRVARAAEAAYQTGHPP